MNFGALRDLHDSANDLLTLPITCQALQWHQQMKWVHKASEASLRMLDVCGTTRDILILVKNHIQDLQSAFRQTHGADQGNATDNKLADYVLIQRKTLKKEMFQCLKRMKPRPFATAVSLSPKEHSSLKVVGKVLREVRRSTVCIMETLVSLIMSVPDPNRRTSSQIFKLKLVAHVRSQRWGGDHRMLAQQSASKRLAAVEIAIEDIEVELECMFRRLIQTRVSLLNILSS